MTSIQSRLGVWLLSSVLVILAMHWLVTSRAPVLFTQDYMAKRLGHDAETLMQGLRFGEAGEPLVEPEYVAPIYLRHDSGHYYLIRTGAHRLSSRSLGGVSIDLPMNDLPQESLVYQTGPDNQKLLVWVGHFDKDGHRVDVAVAEELTTLNRQINRFRLHFGGMTLALLVLLAFTQRLIVRMSMKPLEAMGAACRRLESGDIDTLPENVPAELQPLAAEINRLVGLMRQRLIRSRNALGNLAHALKTPLAVLSQIVQDEKAVPEPEQRRQARASVAMIQSIIDRELKRARLAGPSGAGQIFRPDLDIPDIVGLLKKVYAEKRLDYEMAFKPRAIRYGDREDMLELFGNLLDNASKWADRRVRLLLSLDDAFEITVEDDGPGIPDALQGDLTARGTRLDEAKAGHGLGLSIIEDIVRQYGGDIQFTRSTRLGGLRVDVRLPAATIGRGEA